MWIQTCYMPLASTKTWEFLTRLLLKQRNNSMCVRMFIWCCHGEEQTLLPNCHPPPPQLPVTWWFFCLPSRTSHDSLSESTGTCHPLGQKDGHVNQAWPIIIHVTLTKTWLAQWKGMWPNRTYHILLWDCCLDALFTAFAKQGLPVTLLPARWRRTDCSRKERG